MDDQISQATHLRRILSTRLGLEEIRTLCLYLGVDYEDLGGEGRSAKARELVIYLQRREELSRLVGWLKRHRPDVFSEHPPSRPGESPASEHPTASSVVRIYGIDESVVGAGFLVEARQVLTCAHVADGALAPSGQVRLDFPLLAPDHPLTARVVRRDPDTDVAVLGLLDDPPAGACPVRPMAADDPWGHPFRAFGFPTGHPEGVWAAGVIRGPNAHGWLQIEDTTETGYRVRPGFSGAPVWDDALDGVVGMVTTAERDPHVRAAFIIPASALMAVGPVGAPLASLNPFCDRGRINDPARLFDRRRIRRELRQMLAAGNSVSLVGEPQIGKSSLLYALYRTADEWFPDGTVHYVDLQGVLDEEDFCAEVLEGMGREPGDLRTLKWALRRERMVLLLDEVEKLTRPTFTGDLHDLLRSLAQEETLTLAVASHRPLREIFPPSSDTSPFHNIFTPKQLGPFTPADARAFLRQRLQGTGMTFTPEEIERLVIESGGHPARLQELAYALFEEKQVR